LLQQVQRFHNKKQTTLFLCKSRRLPLLQNLVRQPQSCLLPRITESRRSTCHLFCALFQSFNNKTINKIVCIYPSPIHVFFLFPVLVSFCYYTSKVSLLSLSLSLILSVHVTRSEVIETNLRCNNPSQKTNSHHCFVKELLSNGIKIIIIF